MSGITVKSLIIILFCFLFTFCSKELPPKKEALKLVLESNALGGDLQVDDTIERIIEKSDDEIKSFGWDVSRIDDQIYLVSYRYKIYSFEKGTGELGYFFVSNLRNGSVRNVTEEYTSRMGPLSKPFKDEEEILKEFIDDSSGELEGF